MSDAVLRRCIVRNELGRLARAAGHFSQSRVELAVLYDNAERLARQADVVIGVRVREQVACRSILALDIGEAVDSQRVSMTLDCDG